MPRLGFGLNRSLVPNKKINPKDIPNLNLWYDASVNSSLYTFASAGTIVANNGTIGRIQDLSGNLYHATQGTSSKRARYITNAVKGNAVIRFDGVDDFYTLPINSLAFAGTNNAFTFFVVCAPDLTGRATDWGGGGILRKMDGTGSEKEWYFGARSSGKISMNYVTGQNSIVSGSTISTFTPVILSVVYDFNLGSSQLSRTSMFINNTLQAETAEFGSQGWGIGVELGRGYDGTGIYYFKNDICEVLGYSRALNTTEINKVNSYLNAKWI